MDDRVGRMRTLGVVAMTLLVMACQRAPGGQPAERDAALPARSTSSARPTVSAVAPQDLAYPGATQFCSGHVTGAPTADSPGPHISWVAHTTQDAPDKVAAHYRDKLGSAGHEQSGNEEIWRLPAQQPSKTVSVAPASAAGPWDRCGKPPSDAATVILLSTMARAR